MNATEFNNWTTQHVAAFGDGVREALADAATAEKWFDALEKARYDDACQATKLMLADLDLQPRFVSQHPGMVNKLTLKMWKERIGQRKQKFIHGEEVYDCGRCLDTGFVSVLDPRWVNAVRSEKVTIKEESKCYVLWSRPHRRMAYACCCDLGSVKKHIGQFDPARHFTGIEPTHRDWVQPFFDWLNDHPLPLEQQDF